MINTFPSPYPDETLYSLLGRYSMLSGLLNYIHIMEDLFGDSNKRFAPDFPSGIGILVDRLGNGYFERDIIFQHTLYPYFSAFIPEERAIKIMEKMIGTDGSNIHNQIGINASSIGIKRTLKHCRECMEEDIKLFGETYWHRVHQLPGVFICPQHNRLLIETKKKLYEYDRKKILLVTEDLFIEPSNNDIDGFTFEILSSYAKEANWILNNDIKMSDLNYYRNKYVLILKNMKLASVKGSVNQQELSNRFKQKYKNNSLLLLESEVYKKPSNWLVKIVQKHQKVFHPTRHILFIMFLCGNLINFYENEHKYSPFGQGPWPCLNPAHKLYGQKVITHINIISCKDTGRPVGTFLCECGFSYSRRGPDLTLEDQFKIGRVVKYGEIWEVELKRLISSGLSLGDIARKLKVDPYTVKRKAVLLNIEFSWRGQNLEEAKNSFRFNNKNNGASKTHDIVIEKRSHWNRLLSANQDLGVTGLIILNGSLYSWLYKHDREWLKENSPIKINKQINGDISDWESRDKILYEEVKKIIDNWENDEERPTRITKTLMARKTVKPYLIIKYGHKLPKTLMLINSHIESDDQYYIRKLKWSFKVMVSEDKKITEFGLYKKAAIKKHLVSHKVKMFTKRLLI